MENIKNLSDFENPLVKRQANKLTGNCKSLEEKVRNIFFYVRDDIKFGFPDKGDFVYASETIVEGFGQCNTKSTLFLALCKASGIEACIHFSLIKKDIQKGLITGLLYSLIPENISHSWIEIKILDKWVKIDAFINDKEFYENGKKLLKQNNWDTGFSISCSKNASSIDLDLTNPQFVQMDAVTEDHGVYSDPLDYYKSGKYMNRPNAFTLFVYRLLIKKVNKRIKKMRFMNN